MDDKVVGRAKGGIARAEKLTAEERTNIASKAAQARWANRSGLPKATHRGELIIAGISIPCAVLEDGRRVLSERSVARALGSKGSGAYWGKKKNIGSAMLPEYVSKKYLEPFIDEGVREKLSNTIGYLGISGKMVEALPAELLPEICNIWLKARDESAFKNIPPKDALSAEKASKKADILMRGLAKVGIIALIDEATGYQEIRPQDALQAYLETIIRKELAAWVKKFPDEFYENIYKLKGWVWPGMKKNRFSVVAHYTRDLVYERIAPGVLEELEKKTPENKNGSRKNKMHQWLTDDVGNPMLAQHLHSLIMFQRLALSNNYGWKRFIRMVDQVLPKKGANLELPFDCDMEK